MPSHPSKLAPGTRIQLTGPVYDDAWALFGVLITQVASGTVGTVGKDGRKVTFRNGTCCWLARLPFKLAPPQE